MNAPTHHRTFTITFQMNEFDLFIFLNLNQFFRSTSSSLPSSHRSSRCYFVIIAWASHTISAPISVCVCRSAFTLTWPLSVSCILQFYVELLRRAAHLCKVHGINEPDRTSGRVWTKCGKTAWNWRTDYVVWSPTANRKSITVRRPNEKIALKLFWIFHAVLWEEVYAARRLSKMENE